MQLQAWTEFTNEDSVLLTFAPEGRDDAPLNAEEIAIAQWVPENQTTQKPVLLSAVLKAYPEFRQQFFNDFGIGENEDDLPIVTSADGLPKLITLEEITIHQISKDGDPYIGYQFSCAWDEEHGLGVLMHNDRIVEIGGSDTAFLLWDRQARS